MRKKYSPRPRKVKAAQPHGTSAMNKDEISIRLIRGLWDSLESHLDYCVDPSAEGRRFHRRCVREYADMLLLATKLLSERRVAD